MKTDTPTATSPFLVVFMGNGAHWIEHFYADAEWINAAAQEHEQHELGDYKQWEWHDASGSDGAFRFIRVL